MNGAEITWISIAASVVMGAAGLCLFIFAVKSDYFRDIEDVKYQVFWSEVDELVESTVEPEEHDGKQAKH